jgi:pyruvate-ferredoxin/flavodoxin oxidoreductase
VDGTFPTGTTQWEKRNISLEIPVWEKDLCIQCGKCTLVCPHAVIRAKVYEPSYLEKAPESWQSMDAKWKELPNMKYSLVVAPEDCTGCSLCVSVCPAKDKSQVGRKAINMAPQPPIREREAINWEYFLSLPDVDRTRFSNRTVKNSQLMQPLFEFSGACAGCGETPYIKLLTQLYGDRIVIANATGCSSIYGGNLPTTPYAKNKEGRGPAWSNSLFEDNAEFGLGFRLTLDKQKEYASELLPQFAPKVGDTLVDEILKADQSTELGIRQQRERIDLLKQKLQTIKDPKAKDLLSLADVLTRKSVWIVGGDGWAYDIGYGGLDHVLATGQNVNILVLG